MTSQTSRLNPAPGSAGRRAAFVFALTLAGLAIGACRNATPATTRAEPSTEQAPTAFAPSTAAPAATSDSGADPPRARTAAGVEYLEVLTGGAAGDKPLPMLIALHGRGDRPENWVSSMSVLPAQARVILPRAPDPLGSGYSWFVYRAADKDLGALARAMHAAAEPLAASIAELASQRPTLGKPVLMGFSQGAMLTYTIAVEHPDLLSAAFPISGFLPPGLMPEPHRAVSYPPITTLHGGADDVVPTAASRRAVAKLNELGVAVTWKEYPGVGHRISPEMRLDLASLLVGALTPPVH